MRAQKRVGGAFKADLCRHGRLAIGEQGGNFLYAGLQGVISRVDTHGKGRIGGCVFMPAINGCGVWKRGEFLQALPHLLHGSFKNPSAAQHKQAVADKSVLRVWHVIGNVAQCVPAHIQNTYVMRAKLHCVAVIHFHIDARNTLGLTCRTDNFTAGFFLDLKIIAGMVKMMMRVPNMA